MNTMIRKLDTPLVRKFLMFGLVGGAGALLNTAILWGLTALGMHYLAGAAIATEIAIIFNFFGNHLVTFKESRTGSLKKKFLIFQAVSMVSLVCTLVILYLLTSNFGERFLLLWNLLAIIISSLLNFTLNLKFTWNTAVRS